jgi:hypothetical protein
MLQTKFEVNLLSSFREEDDCWRMTTDAGASPFDTNSSPWAFGSGELKNDTFSRILQYVYICLIDLKIMYLYVVFVCVILTFSQLLKM